MTEPVLRAEALTKLFRIRGQGFRAPSLRAVDDVSFSLAQGTTLAIVGESGCGKTTLARLVAKLLPASRGRLCYDGKDVSAFGRREMRPLRPLVQMVFQDPYSSLDQRMTVAELVAEPLRIHGRYKDWRQIAALIDRVGLNADYLDHRPGALSGGQRQRLSIARALALEPRALILDEPVSALDASIQAQVLNLLRDLQREQGLSYLFISHDLAVVRYIADRVAVMYLGRIVEEGPAEAIFSMPQHPYTQALLSAVPIESISLRATARRRLFSGEPADPIHPPSGCPYRTRCYRAEPLCAATAPPLLPQGDGGIACFFPTPKTLDAIRS